MILAATGRAQLKLQDGDIFVLAQKIVSKSEGRLINLAQVAPSPAALELAEQTGKDPRLVEFILKESDQVLRSKPGTIIVEHRLGFICANAGIDHSSVCGESAPGEDWVLLLPENPDGSAEKLRSALQEASQVSIGVLIIDSHGRPWRIGTTGVTIGLSGVPGIVDLRGEEDLLGYTLRNTQIGAADELAAAASLVMGQAAEGIPVVHVRGFPYPQRDGSLDEILRPEDQDLFR
jgi:coenzyme F420-0:L-glutamate ligase/coenzyme F420-1:gamma-L-glutamate ligase